MNNKRTIILNAQQLRKSQPSEKEIKKIKRQPIVLVLDNILDTFNTGSFFRLADAIAAEKIYLCGQMVTPPNIKIHRASVGTWKWQPWEHYPSTLKLIKKLKREGYFTVAAEQTDSSIPYTQFKPHTPLVLVIGHESRGVDKQVLTEVDQVVELPLLGVNKSLNVLVAASAIVYHWLEKINKA
jgi:tRNA G18 (ribose-2'-O)-methylase SpoU